MSIRLRSGCGVVILIDEYDKTLIQSLDNEELQSKNQKAVPRMLPKLCLFFHVYGRKVYKIGVNFSAETRNIDRWIVAE